ncbi:MAG: gp53-like domain-containing protein [Bacteroidales bacterium]
MAQILKPVNLSLTWASGGDVLNPGDTKYATGWQVEIPPRQWFNYLDNRQDTALAHINQHGVVVWDELTEYQAGKSYVQGITTGAVYRCKQTHTNQDPELDVGEVYWEFAFASPGDFYTKVQADALYLAKASNLADLPNAAAARTNLSVYSQAQTYTKSEVDSKTTVASTLQSQEWTSNTTLLTPLRLAEAFQAANQSLTANGFQKLPGGLIVQWGQTAPAGAGDNVTSLPIPFPTQFLEVYLTQDYVIGSGSIGYAGSVPSSNSQFTWRASTISNAFSFIAIGK